MRLLLDTNVLLWTLSTPEKLSSVTREAIADPTNQVFVSAASAWEIAIKQSVSKLELPGPAETWLPQACARTSLAWIPVTHEDALRVRALPVHHRDPFDRILIAQAQGGYVLVTSDQRFRFYGVSLLEAV